VTVVNESVITGHSLSETCLESEHINMRASVSERTGAALVESRVVATLELEREGTGVMSVQLCFAEAGRTKHRHNNDGEPPRRVNDGGRARSSTEREDATHVGREWR
jgi:hypothetical protein